MRTIYSAFVLILSFIIGAAACAAPDAADAPETEPVTVTVPPVEAEASSGGTSCTLSTTCWSGGIQGHCAKSTINGAAMCCTGCVDSQGYCQAGTTVSQCGGGGRACVECFNAHGTSVCLAGACGIGSCDALWEDCDDDHTDCEKDVSSDPLNCGGCIDACQPGESCAGGICYVP